MQNETFLATNKDKSQNNKFNYGITVKLNFIFNDIYFNPELFEDLK